MFSFHLQLICGIEIGYHCGNNICEKSKQIKFNVRKNMDFSIFFDRLWKMCRIEIGYQCVQTIVGWMCLDRDGEGRFVQAQHRVEGELTWQTINAVQNTAHNVQCSAKYTVPTTPLHWKFDLHYEHCTVQWKVQLSLLSIVGYEQCTIFIKWRAKC